MSKKIRNENNESVTQQSAGAVHTHTHTHKGFFKQK